MDTMTQVRSLFLKIWNKYMVSASDEIQTQEHKKKLEDA